MLILGQNSLSILLYLFLFKMKFVQLTLNMSDKPVSTIIKSIRREQRKIKVIVFLLVTVSLGEGTINIVTSLFK